VAMPHALWTLQGERGLDEKTHRFVEISKGTQSQTEYDATVRDLVNFLVYVSEPTAQQRKAIGIITLFVLIGVLLPLTYWLKKEFWKDVK
jgi:ubiquinol-cytochrome c reductase cytochrome c1 subunit